MTAGLVTLTECITLMLGGIVVLTIAGVNIGGLLLPAAVGLAFASKDLLQNLVAGAWGFRGGRLCVAQGDGICVKRPVAELGGRCAAAAEGCACAEHFGKLCCRRHLRCPQTPFIYTHTTHLT